MKKLIYAFALVGMFIFVAPTNVNADDPAGVEPDCVAETLTCSNGYQFYAVSCSNQDRITWLMMYC